MRNARVTPAMIVYGASAAAGAVVPWYYNMKYMQESGALLTPQAWLAGGFINALTASITTDFLIGTTPVLVWMAVEARRLGMRHWWFYVVTTFLVAFAFACPIFLFMREARLRAPAAPPDLLNGAVHGSAQRVHQDAGCSQKGGGAIVGVRHPSV
jgi:hypothetical protein